MITEREEEILRLIEENPQISQQDLADRCGITRSSVAVHISNLTKKGVIQGKGYVLQRRPYIVVIGGQNMDIFGRPDAPLVPRDSNPGRVRMSQGGVGRNIAHNLALLGEDVKLITAFGEDHSADQLADGCRRAGIDITNALTVPGGATSVYLFITDEHGEMELAVSDMAIYEQITPDFLRGRLDFINRAALCVVDTNLTAEALAFLAEHVQCPLFVDTVSTAKAKKLQGLLGSIHTIKANRIESELLTGITIDSDGALREAAERFLDLGVRQVFLSLGDDGLYCADGNELLTLPNYPTEMVNTTGAGDSLMAALAWSHRQALSLEQTARAGLAAASICIGSAETVSPDMNADAIHAIIQ